MLWSEVKKDITTISEEEKLYIELLATIVGIREEKGLTQRELAELTGLKQSAIARFENPSETANVTTVLKYVQALGYDLTIKPKES